MADNLELNAGSGGATVATDEDGSSVHWPYTKLVYGEDDTQTRVSDTDPLPIKIHTSTLDVMLGTDFSGVFGSSNIVATEDSAALTLGVQAIGRYDATARTLDDGDAGAIALDAEGRVQTAMANDNVVSTNNSSTSTLGISAVYTGTGEDVSKYAAVTVSILADQDSANDGSQFQFSSDNTNWDDANTFTVSANVARRFQFPVTAQYFRVVYTNGGTGQGAFRLQTILHRQPVTPSVHRISDDMSTDRSVFATKSVLFAQQGGSGNFTAVDSTTSNELTVRDSATIADDAPFTLTSSFVNVIGGIRDDSLSALAAAEGDAVPIRVSSTGAVHVTGGGGGTQYNVDDAAGGTDTGTLLLAVRDDSLTTLTPADGDYTQLRVSSTGALHVTGGGGGTEYSEDVATPATIVGTATLMERDDALSTVTPVEGDWIGFRGNARGALWVELDTTNDVTIADGGNSITVDNAGTFAVQVDGAALTALQLIDNVVYTHDAAGGTAVGNMMMAQRDDEVGSTATTSADGDAAALTVNKFSQLKTTEIADQTSEIKYAVIDDATSGNNTLVAAAGGGIKIRVLSLFLVAAGTVNVRFESGAGGTALTGQMALVANTGFSLPYNPGGWFETADNALLNLELSAAVSCDGCLSYVEV